MDSVQHIFLTGFMGSGKSTLGKKLAPLMQCKFIDLDTYIEKKEGCSVQLIFDIQGEAAFRHKETLYLEELMATSEPLIVALGGGTVCFGNNLNIVKKHGLLIYLDLPVQVLAQRLSGSRKKRPLLQGLSGNALQDAITQKLEQRQPFYRQANIIISGALTPAILHQAILDAKQNHSA